MYANKAIELMDRASMEELQLERLKKQIKWACSKSSFYQKKFTEAGISTPKIESLEDFHKLPFTTIPELVSASPYDFLTVPLTNIIRIAMHKNSEHTVFKMFTAGDIARHIEMTTRGLIAAGINNASKVGLLWNMTDTRILDVQYALENIGATAIILGTDLEHASALLEICKPDVLISNFRLITQLMIHMQACTTTTGFIGTEIQSETYGKELHVPLVMCLEDSMRNPMRTYIEKRLEAKVVGVYNSPGMGCAGIMFPCQQGDGLHLHEDYFYPEIVNFGSDEVIEDCSHVGELVLTTLTAEAMPVIRYRTGQTAMRLDDPCPCGRTLVRVATPTEYISF